MTCGDISLYSLQSSARAVCRLQSRTSLLRSEHASPSSAGRAAARPGGRAAHYRVKQSTKAGADSKARADHVETLSKLTSLSLYISCLNLGSGAFDNGLWPAVTRDQRMLMLQPGAHKLVSSVIWTWTQSYMHEKKQKTKYNAHIVMYHIAMCHVGSARESEQSHSVLLEGLFDYFSENDI